MIASLVDSMETSQLGYADLIRSSDSKYPISSILTSLTDNGALWAALLTTSGRPIESVMAGTTTEAESQELAEAVAILSTAQAFHRSHQHREGIDGRPGGRRRPGHRGPAFGMR